MAVYGGFTNGSYNAWALNLLFNNFGTAGILRGMGVTAPGGMQVTVGVDPTAQDGVVWLGNGCFVRIDAATTFSVPSNGTGGTRTDAVVAFVDPTGNSNPNFSLTYQTNWAGGFGGASANQFVVALVSVASGASNITSGNLSLNTAVAKLGGGGGGGGSSMTASDGVGFGVQDNSTTAQVTLVTTGLTTGVGRTVVVAATDVSGNSHYFYFRPDGLFGLAPPGLTFDPQAINGETAASVTLTAASGGGAASVDTHYANPTPGWFYFDMGSASVHINQFGVYSGPAAQVLVANGSYQRIFTGLTTPTNATNGDIWIQA